MMLFKMRFETDDSFERERFIRGLGLGWIEVRARSERVEDDTHKRSLGGRRGKVKA